MFIYRGVPGDEFSVGEVKMKIVGCEHGNRIAIGIDAPNDVQINYPGRKDVQKEGPGLRRFLNPNRPRSNVQGSHRQMELAKVG